MSCLSPLKGWPIGVTKNGRPRYKITNYNVCAIIYDRGLGKWVDIYEEHDPSGLTDEDRRNYQREFVELPCGKCLECRLQHSKEWAARCMLEAAQHQSNYFLTLTYDDEHLPKTPLGVPTLRKSDMPVFIKALRQELANKNRPKVRFFGCGEYGTKTKRPHMHIIVFGLQLDDLKFYKRSKLGDVYYTSDFLEKIWKKGNIIVGACDYESCAYTARYVVKKAQDSSMQDYIDGYMLEPEFLNMSRRPGIAYDSFVVDPDIYGHNKRWLVTSKGGVSYVPPRYFKRLYERDYPGDSASRSYRDNMALHNAALEEVRYNDLTDLSKMEYLEMLADKKARAIMALIRDTV